MHGLTTRDATCPATRACKEGFSIESGNLMIGVCMKVEQVKETLSTCRFAQRMAQVAVSAQRNSGGLSSVHGSLMKLDPGLQQYLTVCFAAHNLCSADVSVSVLS